MGDSSLTPDEVLTTTRAVRRRLDLTRPVPRGLIEECLEIALQAPTGSNRQGWHFVVVTDPEKRRVIGSYYRRGWQAYRASGQSAASQLIADPGRAEIQRRVGVSASYLADHMGDVPVLVIPCIEGRTDGSPSVEQAGVWGSILPATWSFMLAARARGLGTAWTSLHLPFEREVAELLGIPYDRYLQAALIPVAYVIGNPFHPGPREPLDAVVSWNTWGG